MQMIERKLSVFFKKYQNLMTFIALPLVVAGFLLHHTVLGSVLQTPEAVMVPCFLIAALLCGLPVAFRAIMALKWKTISIELLVTIAVAGALLIGEYSECGIVTFLFQFGNYLEVQTLKKTRSAIKDLVAFLPATATLITKDGLEETDLEDVDVGNRLLVKEGSKVPVDGFIAKGEGYFSEANITGESKPVHKREGDFIYAGSILESGLIEMTASRVGEDTTYGKIVELVEEAEDAKSPVERFVDRFARYYTPFVIVAAFVTLLLTRNVDTSVTVLVLACPGALVIGAPIASVSGIGKGARKGILFKGGDVIHTFAQSNTFLFDKTGTLTYGDSRVNELISYFPDHSVGDMPLIIGAAAESRSNHPLGKAIVAYAKAQGTEEYPLELDPVTVKGQGLITQVNHKKETYVMLMGNETLFKNQGFSLTDAVKSDINRLTRQGNSIVLQGFIHQKTPQGPSDHYITLLFGISDTIREGSREALSLLKKESQGNICMLTGDHLASASYTANKLGITSCQANLLPDDKYRILCDFQEKGYKVCFIGDGINDSPSITKADTGIAMGKGTDVAIACSDIVILNSDISMLPQALRLARHIVAVTIENLIIAIATVLFLIAGLFADYIHMSSGMLIHEMSIFVVILNGMRLLAGSK